MWTEISISGTSKLVCPGNRIVCRCWASLIPLFGPKYLKQPNAWKVDLLLVKTAWTHIELLFFLSIYCTNNNNKMTLVLLPHFETIICEVLHLLFRPSQTSYTIYGIWRLLLNDMGVNYIFRGIPTHRGWVKKIRFAPGKGNQKLLVMYTDGAEVWDTKEVSPLRTDDSQLSLCLFYFNNHWNTQYITREVC